MPPAPDRVAYWADVVGRMRRSGLSKPEFCRRDGVSPGSLKNWLYTPEYRQAIELHLAKADPPAGPVVPTPRLVPVVVRQDPAPAPNPPPEAPLQVVVGPGLRVAVGPGFDPDTLRRLVEALGARP